MGGGRHRVRLSDATGALEESRMRRLVELAHGAGACFTLHRAFDVPRSHGDAFLLRSPGSGSDPDVGGRKIPAWRVSPSAGAAYRGKAYGNPDRRRCGRRSCSAAAGRASCSETVSYERKNRAAKRDGIPEAGVSMGLPSLSEFELWRTEERNVRAAREALDQA